MIRILYRLMRKTTIETSCIHLVNSIHEVQSSSKHYSMFKQHSSTDDQKTRASLLNKAIGCWSLDPIRLLHSTPTRIRKKRVQTPKLPLNGRRDSFIKPRMRHWVTAKHSGSSEFFVSLPLHSAICAVLCLKAELESGGHTSAGFRFQSVTHLWWGRDGWVWSKCHPKFCSYSMCSVAEKRRFLLLVFFIS